MLDFRRHILIPLLALVPALGGSAGSTLAQSMPMSLGDMSCGLDQPAFCDGFDQPSTSGGRTGQLDPQRWSVAHVSGAVNTNQGLVDEWVPTKAMHCKTPVTGVIPNQDFFMCGPEFGESMHFMEAIDDNHSYVYNDAMIRQPFDFANRTGKITFDVDAKTSGSHGWWVELWLTDQPVPAPHADSDPALPQNGVAVRFHNPCWQGPPAGEAGAPKTTVGEVDVVHNFALDTAPPWGDATKTGLLLRSPDCIDVMPDMKNHFEVRINQQHLEVWATDAMGSTMKQIAKADGLNLGFTRGYVHVQHSQYNASKAGPGVVDYQTYHWDNIGFDGPKLPVAAKYSIPDAMSPGADPGAVNLGYAVSPAGVKGGPRTFDNVNLSGASGAMLTFNPWFGTGSSMKYRLNGGAWHMWTGPDPGPFGGTNWRTAAAPVSLSELQNGSNTVDFASATGDTIAVANIDLVLQGAGVEPAPAPAPADQAQPQPMAPGMDMSQPSAPAMDMSQSMPGMDMSQPTSVPDPANSDGGD